MSVNAPLLPMLSTPGLRSRTNSTGILYLGVWYKKWSNWSCGVGVGQKNPTSTPNVVRNPTLPKNLRLLPTPPPCSTQWCFKRNWTAIGVFVLFQDSPIIDFYPEDFKIDLNGKKYAWQGVALLPFVDEERMIRALDGVYPDLTGQECKFFMSYALPT